MNTYGLNIHLESFHLNRQIAQSNDKIRVSITSIPEEYKEAFVIDCNKTSDTHHFFTINVTNQTKKIIFVFRKKSFINNDPIIASTIVHINELPKNEKDTNNTELKTINIYEPFQKIKNTYGNEQNRRVVGQMQVQFSPTDAFPSYALKQNNKNESYKLEMVTLSSANKSYNGYGHMSNENQNHNFSQFGDQGLFVDPDPEQIKNLNQLDNKFQFNQQPQQNQQQYQYQQPQQNQQQYQYQQPQNQYQQPQQNQQQYQYQQPQNQYQQNQQQYQQQPQNQYQQQPQQNQQQNQYQQQQPNKMVFVNDLI